MLHKCEYVGYIFPIRAHAFLQKYFAVIHEPRCPIPYLCGPLARSARFPASPSFLTLVTCHPPLRTYSLNYGNNCLVKLVVLLSIYGYWMTTCDPNQPDLRYTASLVPSESTALEPRDRREHFTLLRPCQKTALLWAPAMESSEVMLNEKYDYLSCWVSVVFMCFPVIYWLLTLL